jgi:phosphomannomutase
MMHIKRTVNIQKLMDASGVHFGTSGVRGLVAAMSDEVCFAYVSAFLKTLPLSVETVALAMDLRPSSLGIAKACAAAIRHVGLNVEFCGSIPTPALAYFGQKNGLPAIMVTGSHIPFDRNGIKFYGVSGEITKTDESTIRNQEVIIPETGLKIELPHINNNAETQYINRYRDFFMPGCFEGMRLGLYEHSGVGRDLLKTLLQKLGAVVISLGRTDEFVPIDTEAVGEIDIQRARRWAEEHAFDAILSTDGDADRPLIGDEAGNWFRGDIAGILCAQYLAAQTVVTTVSSNTAVELSEAFDRVIRTRIGSPYVIEGMENLIKLGAEKVVGFEPNGGFLVGTILEKNFKKLMPLMTRDALLPMLCVLALARERACKVSEVSAMLPNRYTASDRLQNYPTEIIRNHLSDRHMTIEIIDELLNIADNKAVRFDQTDGLRIFLENGDIVHFRPSGNAPELRCYAESDTQEKAAHLVNEGLRRIGRIKFS